MKNFQSGQLGLMVPPASTPGKAAAPPPAPKKTPMVSKQLSSKISAASGKLTEIMAWDVKVKDCKSLSLSPFFNSNLDVCTHVFKVVEQYLGLGLRSSTLLKGFSSELATCKQNIVSAKQATEAVYAKVLPLKEPDIQKNTELMGEVSASIASLDSAFTSLTGTIKSIKSSVESQLILFST